MEQPETVKNAALLWATAITAGIVETVLAVSEIARDSDLDAGVWMNIGVRSAVYLGAFVLVAFFARGRRWARIGLALLLSVVGLGAMVVPSAIQLADGESLIAAVGGDGEFAMAFFVVRLLHIAAVLLATALMFSPGANAHFRKPQPVTA
ncbi:hypothetical protein O1R50_06705 [Glycomyces luteolus]|uniref:Uncharacterized protein n=1 Tax=Glycomyces luteolus TaxID=2670330 RepID=A0A9X3P9A9_9ACTN|nr:hypothetical protein [Glycomyces luteolus]MDA1359303.1 hypothetical protein [Glycomyces luteolus]